MAGTLNIGSPSTTSPLPTTTGYYVEGTKVLGAQGSLATFTAATSNVATDITNMSNAIANIIELLKNHGLGV